jgi:hypothetical protein
MTIGPIEYIIVGFPGNQFTGQIAPALADLIDNNTIRILDLVFISKDADGEVTAFEYDELEELAAFGDLDGEVGGLIGPDDIAHAAEGLDPNSPRRCSSGRTPGPSPRRGDAQLGRRAARGRRIPHDLAEEAFAGLARPEPDPGRPHPIAARSHPTHTGGHDHHAPRTTTSGKSGGHDRRRGRHGHPRTAAPSAARTVAAASPLPSCVRRRRR